MFDGVMAPTNMAPTTAQSDADALEEEDSRNLARDARASSANCCWNGVAPCRERPSEIAAAPRAAASSRFGVHVRGASQGSIPIGTAAFMRRSPATSLARLPRSRFPIRPIHRQSGSCPAASPMRRGASRHAGPHEISQWPTKCSSTRPIRRRPGWSSCAAIASRNSTLSPRTASNYEAISIWRR